MTLRVASWNIAGGHTIASLEHFDYQGEDIAYFSQQLKKQAPDIICLQESHTHLDGSYANTTGIAEYLHMHVIINSANSPSHINSDFQLSNSIISRIKPIDVVQESYPDPDGTLYWPDGKVADTHKKNLQVVMFETFNIANTQMLPVNLFGFTYDDHDRGAKLVRGINEVMKEIVKPPIIWCGDFNFDEPLKIYPYLEELKLAEALPDVTTRPSRDNQKKKSDHILYSPEFTLIGSEVIPTNTDHFLCIAEFEIIV
jgi:endonuclease/exonuclease/phosphatase family metal-dependent hydrolase